MMGEFLAHRVLRPLTKPQEESRHFSLSFAYKFTYKPQVKHQKPSFGDPGSERHREGGVQRPPLWVTGVVRHVGSGSGRVSLENSLNISLIIEAL